jgi:hypothetical protein
MLRRDTLIPEVSVTLAHRNKRVLVITVSLSDKHRAVCPAITNNQRTVTAYRQELYLELKVLYSTHRTTKY